MKTPLQKPVRKADAEWMPFVLSTAERKAAHKWLVEQARGNVPEPIHNLTLNGYFRIVREAMLALCDEDGLYREWGIFRASPKNYRKMTPREAAEACMDGRSLFHSDYGDVCGILGAIDPDDPVKFKWWVANARPGGHPWETTFGNFSPYPLPARGLDSKNEDHPRFNPRMEVKVDRSQYYTDDWQLCFSTFHRCTPFAFRCFIRLRELGFPVIWAHGRDDRRWLTKRYAVDASNAREGLHVPKSK